MEPDASDSLARSAAPSTTRHLTLRVALVSAALGVAWDAGILHWLGAPEYLPEFGSPYAGAIAGLACGWLTMRSRHRREGHEDALDTITGYYLTAGVYGAAWYVLFFVPNWWNDGPWYQVLRLLWEPIVVAGFSWVLATFLAILLFPFWLLTRFVIWRSSGQRRTVEGPATPVGNGEPPRVP